MKVSTKRPGTISTNLHFSDTPQARNLAAVLEDLTLNPLRVNFARTSYQQGQGYFMISIVFDAFPPLEAMQTITDNDEDHTT